MYPAPTSRKTASPRAGKGLQVSSFRALGRGIGETPLVALPGERVDLFVKLETHNLSGSVKDRPAFHILDRAIEDGLVDAGTTVVESSSGNFAIALATLCRSLGLPFVAVVDININPANEKILKTLGSEVVSISERDATGGCLLNRIAKVREICAARPNTFWPNQYENPLNGEAHFLGTGAEICRELPGLDYVFVGVSSGGTIAGISRRVREDRPEAKIVAVDVEGSAAFGDTPKPRYIPGIGSSLRPVLLEQARIDEVVLVSEADSVQGSRELLDRHGLFLGGSSGTVYRAVQSFFAAWDLPRRPTVAFVAADRGHAYLDRIYDPVWAREKLGV